MKAQIFSQAAEFFCLLLPLPLHFHLVCRSLFLAKGLVCAKLTWPCWLVLMVGERDQATAVRMETMFSVDSSCYASSFWKNRALLFLSFCLLSSCLLVCFGPVCLSLSVSFVLPQPFSLSPSNIHILSTFATRLPLALLSLGEC